MDRGKRFVFAQNTLSFGLFNPRSEQIWVKKKTRPKEENGLASSPSRSSPRRRRHHPRRQLPASSDAAQHAPQLPRVRSSLPSGQILRSRPLPPARNATPMARVSGRASPARLRRPRFVPPSFLAGIHHPYTSHSLHVLCCRCRWSTPWEFPIHHGHRHQGLLHGDVEDAMDLQLQGSILSTSPPLPFPSLPHLVSFPSHAGQQGGTLAISTSSDDASATPR